MRGGKPTISSKSKKISLFILLTFLFISIFTFSCSSSTSSDNPPGGGVCTGSEANHPNNSYCNPIINPDVCTGSEANHPNNSYCDPFNWEEGALPVQTAVWGDTGEIFSKAIPNSVYAANTISLLGVPAGIRDSNQPLDRGTMFFNLVEAVAGDPSKVYLVTQAQVDTTFTFHLLFVKNKADADGKHKGIEFTDVKYLNPDNHQTVYAKVSSGDWHWDLNTTLDPKVAAALKKDGYSIYMSVTDISGMKPTAVDDSDWKDNRYLIKIK